jgi:hypothetical protein
MAEQKNARRSSKKMQDGRAKKCKMVEQKKSEGGRFVVDEG